MLEEKKGMYFGGSVRWIDKVYRSGNEVFAKSVSLQLRTATLNTG